MYTAALVNIKRQGDGDGRKSEYGAFVLESEARGFITTHQYVQVSAL